MIDGRIDQVVQKVQTIELPGYGEDEVSFLAETVFALEPDFICEWGTNRGSSARIFYESCQLLRVTPWIYTVELPNKLAPVTADHPGIQTGMFIRKLQGITAYRGDGITTAMKLYRRASPSRPLFFVDGDHSFQTVYKELRTLLSEAKNAVVVVHDTNHPEGRGPTGPAEAINALVWDRYRKTELLSQAGMVRLWPEAS